MASFSSSHRTVRYDLRGFGRSSIPPGSYAHALDLAEVMEMNGLESASIVGRVHRRPGRAGAGDRAS